MSPKSSSRGSSQRPGFTLAEVTIALGLVAFALLAIFALLPVSLNVTRHSEDEAVAGSILTFLIADIDSTSREAASSPRFGMVLEDGSASGLFGEQSPLYFDRNGAWLEGVSPADAAEAARIGAYFMASYQVRDPNPADHTPANARIHIQWPALAIVPSGGLETLNPVNGLTR